MHRRFFIKMHTTSQVIEIINNFVGINGITKLEIVGIDNNADDKDVFQKNQARMRLSLGQRK